MKNEAEFKSAFKKSVRAQKGYSISLAAPMLSGIPDLYVIMPGYMPILLEAKWLGEVGLSFRRKIQYKPMQMLYLDECCKVHPKAAMGLIGFKQGGKYWATMKTRIIGDKDEYIDWQCVHTPYIDKKFNVEHLFHHFDVPKFTIDRFPPVNVLEIVDNVADTL